MPGLLLPNIPETLLREIEHLAKEESVSVPEETVRLLKEAIKRRRTHNSPPVSTARTTPEILDDIAHHPFKPDPDGPSVVDMLREDRNR